MTNDGGEEGSRRADRMRDVWDRKRSLAFEGGSMTTRCPAWLVPNVDRTGFDPIPCRVETVRRIFALYAQGLGALAIAKRLTKEGVPTFGRGANWSASGVDRLLKSPATIGIFQPCRMVSGRREPVGDLIPDYYPVVIDAGLYNRCLAVRAERRPPKRRSGKPRVSNLFSGLAKCGTCGASMRYVDKGGRAYLVCADARLGVCDARGWPYADFEKSFLALVPEVDLGSLVRREDLSSDKKNLRAEEDGVLTRLSALKEERDRAFALLTNATIGTDYIRGRIEETSGRIGQEEESLERIRSLLDPSTSFSPDAETLRSVHARLRSEDANVEERSRAAALIRDQVSLLQVYPDGMKQSNAEIMELARSINDQVLERFLDENVTKRRQFAVMPKEGPVSIRVVCPDPKDPGRAEWTRTEPRSAPARRWDQFPEEEPSCDPS